MRGARKMNIENKIQDKYIVYGYDDPANAPIAIVEDTFELAYEWAKKHDCGAIYKNTVDFSTTPGKTIKSELVWIATEKTRTHKGE